MGTGKAFMRTLFFFLSFVVILSSGGCGSMEETTDEWTEPPAVSPTARLEYRIDSLMNENRMMRQQIDAMAMENRSLTARAAELETRLSEAEAAKTAPPMTVTPSSTTPSMSSGSSTGYDAALEEYRRKNFAGAAEQFEALLQGGVSENLKDNCHYWIGECMYGERKYSDAVSHFERVFDYVTSEKKDDAQYMIGNCYLAMGDKAKAKEEYGKVLSNYPTSEFVPKAQEKMSRLP